MNLAIQAKAQFKAKKKYILERCGWYNNKGRHDQEGNGGWW
jgi:hypothetical protein